MSERIEALQNRLRAEQVDAFFVTSEVSREYLSGFRAADGWMLITQEEAYLLVDSRYIEAAQNQAKGCKGILFTQMLETLRGLVEKHHIQSMIAEQSRVTVAEWNSLKKAFPSVELIDSPLLDQELNALRAVKTEKEFADLREAQRLTEEAFERMLTFLRPGVTEREAALEIEFYMRRHGAESVAFDLIVITGAKTSMPHGVPGEEVIQSGDFVTMDTGAVINGMHSDMTRTVAIGHASDEMKHVYDTVLRAQLNAITPVCAAAMSTQRHAARSNRRVTANISAIPPVTVLAWKFMRRRLFLRAARTLQRKIWLSPWSREFICPGSSAFALKIWFASPKMDVRILQMQKKNSSSYKKRKISCKRGTSTVK